MYDDETMAEHVMLKISEIGWACSIEELDPSPTEADCAIPLTTIPAAFVATAISPVTGDVVTTNGSSFYSAACALAKALGIELEDG